jgi:hypothetical protein
MKEDRNNPPNPGQIIYRHGLPWKIVAVYTVDGVYRVEVKPMIRSGKNARFPLSDFSGFEWLKRS